MRRSTPPCVGSPMPAGWWCLTRHQCAFNPREQPYCVAVYGTLIREAQARGAWVATMGEIARHLETRAD